MAEPFAETSIEIDAPIDRIWAVMTDLEHYGDWNPFIVRISRVSPPVGMGSRFRLHVRWHSGGGAFSDELVTRFEPPAPGPEGRRVARLEYLFEGPLVKLGMVHALRVQTLEELPSGRVRYFTRESFRGWATAFLPLARVQRGFELHAEALARRAASG